MPPTRRHALILSLALLLPIAGCAPREPPVFERMDFDYLTKLKLNVGRVDIDDGWVPSGAGRQVGYLAPTRPEAALRAMAESRLVPGAMQGRAVFSIDDASIVQRGGTYVGSFAVHLDLFGPDDQPDGRVEAHVRASRPVTDDGDQILVRTDLDVLVHKMMSDMNVEFEFQLRKALRDQLQSTSPDAPAPAPVETQDLSTPPGTVPPPAPVPGLDPAAPATILSPPPAMLAPPPATLPPLGPPVVVTTPP